MEQFLFGFNLYLTNEKVSILLQMRKMPFYRNYKWYHKLKEKTSGYDSENTKRFLNQLYFFKHFSTLPGKNPNVRLALTRLCFFLMLFKCWHF